MTMTVQQMIEVLSKIEDKSQSVEIAVRQSNKVYPVAYIEPWEVEYFDNYRDGLVRINASLPSNMHTVTRKE